MRYKKLNGETFWSTKENEENIIRLIKATPYPPRMWRRMDWKEYYLPKLKPSRLTDRQWQIIMLILSLIGAAILAHGSASMLE